MTEHGGARCAVLARAADEPLAGTAPVAARWLAVEHRGAWPRPGDAGSAGAALAARAAAAGWRLLLVRRPEHRASTGPRRVFLADTRAAQLTALDVADPGDVPLPAAGPLPGSPVPDPLLLVCTHGRRDRCCALDGRALVTALVAAGEPHVWECTHLGGHRFAPTALVLPTGYAYGRLDPATAVAARKAAALGEVETALCRGRTAWAAAGQVADLAVRAALGVRDAAAVVVGPAVDGDPATGGDGRAACEQVPVTVHGGRRFLVPVQRTAGPARPLSCGAGPATVPWRLAGPPRALDGPRA